MSKYPGWGRGGGGGGGGEREMRLWLEGFIIIVITEQIGDSLFPSRDSEFAVGLE